MSLAVLASTWLRHPERAQWRPNFAEAMLLSWFMVGLISSVLSSHDRTTSLKVLALFAISSLAMVLPRRLLRADRELLDQVVWWLLLAFVIESGFAVTAYFLHVFGPAISLSTNPAGGHLNAYGTLWEPNVLGAICGAGALAWVYLGRRYFRYPWLGTAICFAATVVSFTRAAWLAVIVVLILSLITPVRRRIDLRSIALAAAATLVVIGGVLLADRVASYYPPSSNLVGVLGNQTDIVGRFYQSRSVLDDLRSMPILGGGIDSFGQRHVVAGTPQHLASLMLGVANDTGLVGVLLFAIFVLAIVLAAWRSRSDAIVLGFAAMTLVIGITNQATETLELMITWLLVGLLLAGIDVARAVNRPATADTGRGNESSHRPIHSV